MTGAVERQREEVREKAAERIIDTIERKFINQSSVLDPIERYISTRFTEMRRKNKKINENHQLSLWKQYWAPETTLDDKICSQTFR